MKATCEQCNATFRSYDPVELAALIGEHMQDHLEQQKPLPLPKPSKAKESELSLPPSLKRLSDISTHIRYEGEPTTIDDILDEDVLILAFQSRKSQFEGRETYLAIQIEHGNKKKVISTGSGPIIDALEGITPDELPVIARFSQARGKSGRRYYTVL